MHYHGTNQEMLVLESIEGNHADLLTTDLPSALTFLWFKSNQSVKLDGLILHIKADQILCLTEFHHVENDRFDNVRLIRFNRSFYCIKDHDDEVSCKGLLFYTAAESPIITIPKSEISKFEILWEMFSIEMTIADNLQFEMLQMMLKRLIILCTRIYKSEYPLPDNQVNGWDVIREFNLLVEIHFRKEHTVAAYASMLNRSPKTLANYFSQQGSGRPLHIIQERIMLEVRRLLRYSDKSIKEIAYEIGYKDIQAFSRAFRQKEGIAPSDFRKQKFSS
jgi:AraC family transcriptional activator of pobA